MSNEQKVNGHDVDALGQVAIPIKRIDAKTAAELADIGHEYNRVARMVLLREGLSPLATAIYAYLETVPWHDNATAIIGLGSIMQRFHISENTARKGINELRTAGFIAKTRPGHMQENEYDLLPRRKRIDHFAKQKAEADKQQRKAEVSDFVAKVKARRMTRNI